jgi:hypothetical protein
MAYFALIEELKKLAILNYGEVDIFIAGVKIVNQSPGGFLQFFLS